MPNLVPVPAPVLVLVAATLPVPIEVPITIPTPAPVPIPVPIEVPAPARKPWPKPAAAHAARPHEPNNAASQTSERILGVVVQHLDLSMSSTAVILHNCHQRAGSENGLRIRGLILPSKVEADSSMLARLRQDVGSTKCT